jgi:hypothetical protein
MSASHPQRGDAVNFDCVGDLAIQWDRATEVQDAYGAARPHDRRIERQRRRACVRCRGISTVALPDPLNKT